MRAITDPLNLLLLGCLIAGLAVVVTGTGAVLEAWRARHERHRLVGDEEATTDGTEEVTADVPVETAATGAVADKTGPWERPRPFVDHEETGEAPTDLVRLTAGPLAEAAAEVVRGTPADQPVEAQPAAGPLVIAAPRAAELVAPAERSEPSTAAPAAADPASRAPSEPSTAAPTPAAEPSTGAQPSHVRLVPPSTPTSAHRPLAEQPPAPAAAVVAAPADAGTPAPASGDGVLIDAPTASQVAATSGVVDLATERARRTGQHPVVTAELDEGADRHPSGSNRPRGRLPRGAEAALQSILEIRPDPRNTVALQRDPTAEVRLTRADRAAAARRHGGPPEGDRADRTA